MKKEIYKYIILAVFICLWILSMFIVWRIEQMSIYDKKYNKFRVPVLIPIKKPAYMMDINTLMPEYRLLPTGVYPTKNPYADRYIKTKKATLFTANSRLGEGDVPYSGFYRGMLWYNSVFNKYENRDWFAR
jgi:hypothetical protein